MSAGGPFERVVRKVAAAMVMMSLPVLFPVAILVRYVLMCLRMVAGTGVGK